MNTPIDPATIKRGETIQLERDSALHRDIVEGIALQPDGGFSIALRWTNRSYLTADGWEITAHQPAPEPEPEWKPGTVAYVQTLELSGVATLDYDGTAWRSLDSWYTVSAESVSNDPNSTIRPLVVIDPADVDLENLVGVAGDRDSWSMGTRDYRDIVVAVLSALGIEAAS